jgi:hypothetical protein
VVGLGCCVCPTGASPASCSSIRHCICDACAHLHASHPTLHWFLADEVIETSGKEGQVRYV